ncbi:uncharacterized protein LOC110989474 isoform X3 [Acanthaster planci]|uniref:Uncharacterized protein LOC110989474 isoform X3 n=1 Tax=Acanthaster planci TaxID=133434 RepID=A0A8B7ZXT1_ACAPL|nr:uncharacterized protein LOC110989474 isoform X3 [Acanthaster planci]
MPILCQRTRMSCCEKKFNFKPSTKYVPVTVAYALLICTTTLFFVFPLPCLVNTIHPAVAVYSAVLFSVVFLNFVLATFVDPGVFPKTKGDEDGDEDFRAPLYKTAEIQGIQVRMKWCATCRFYRPPRSSHCSVCNHCIEVTGKFRSGHNPFDRGFIENCVTVFCTPTLPRYIGYRGFSLSLASMYLPSSHGENSVAQSHVQLDIDEAVSPNINSSYKVTTQPFEFKPSPLTHRVHYSVDMNSLSNESQGDDCEADPPPHPSVKNSKVTLFRDLPCTDSAIGSQIEKSLKDPKSEITCSRDNSKLIASQSKRGEPRSWNYTEDKSADVGKNGNLVPSSKQLGIFETSESQLHVNKHTISNGTYYPGSNDIPRKRRPISFVTALQMSEELDVKKRQQLGPVCYDGLERKVGTQGNSIDAKHLSETNSDLHCKELSSCTKYEISV